MKRRCAAWSGVVRRGYTLAVTESLHINIERAREALDLDRRLRLIPAFAGVRGVFINLARDALVRNGLGDALLAAPDLFQPRKAFELHPVRELLLAHATAGALLHPDPVEGVARIARFGSPLFANSWLGDRFRKLFMPDPFHPLRWIERSRDHLCNYGFWRLERCSPRHLVLHMYDEYTWIEPWHRGGCEGLLRQCGVEGTVVAEIDGPFVGRLHIRWD